MRGVNLDWTRSWKRTSDRAGLATNGVNERSAPRLLLGAALISALAWPVAAWPQAEPAEAPPAPTVPPSERAPPEGALETVPSPPALPAPTPLPDQWTWMDASHRFLSRGFLWAVVRFDRFFADERDVDLPRASSFVRWRNTLAIRNDGRHSYAPDIRVDGVFPSLDRRLDQLRLRLAFSTTRPEVVDPLLPPTLRSADVPNRPYAGLVLSPFQALQAQTDLQTGAILRRPLGWYTRARFRHVQAIGDVIVARLALAGFWQTDLRFGTRQELSLEHPLTPWLLIRLDGTSMVAQRSHGWEWSSELALLAAAWPRVALSASVAALGATRAGPGADAWRVQVRARHDVLRRWIFLEVAPESVWTRSSEPNLHRANAVIIRLDIQFDASSGPGPAGAGAATPELGGSPRRRRRRRRANVPRNGLPRLHLAHGTASLRHHHLARHPRVPMRAANVHERPTPRPDAGNVRNTGPLGGRRRERRMPGQTGRPLFRGGSCRIRVPACRSRTPPMAKRRKTS